ncbi:MAG: acetyl-CoA carboxylase biotin carboxyl carrier protein subunit [Proteobacteria bacterium]|nr:acetyl-CoA carboxylase biotin carboxyl carrier protein subunit [Cystobacterineae bacterium]MCL2259660.1 acetyl-CoA carboxylase biotin carboxyl carrier protein subunit [Cystobacterineae bacterium]MCL2313798.1 acetyl-CoA carboxylase biotin carboxyl carrier protein subunit [Pseudomonadota bacterium]
MTKVVAHITGTVWKIQCSIGQTVAEGDVLLILESMKMEMPLESPEAGIIESIHCSESQPVNEGDVLVVLKT